MYTYAEHRACSYAGSYRQKKILQFRIECEKLEAMVDRRLEQGKSLSNDVLLRQSALIDEMVVEEMLLSEVSSK